MVYVKFNDNPLFYPAIVSKETENIVKVTFLEVTAFENTSGFRFYLKTDGRALGIYDRFKTVYKLEDDSLYLSCNGSVSPTPGDQTIKERIKELEKENAELSEELTAAQMALCEVYEMVGGLIDG